MRNIKRIIIHHSVTPRDLELDKSLRSFDRTHKTRLHPNRNSFGYHIAYHYVIAGNGDMERTRDHDEIGYHASSMQVNEESVGVCLTGNFDAEHPSDPQLEVLDTIISEIRASHNIIEITGHRKYSSKSCPGINFTEAMIEDLQPDEFKKYKEWWRNVTGCNDEDWDKPPTKQEHAKMMNEYTKTHNITT